MKKSLLIALLGVITLTSPAQNQAEFWLDPGVLKQEFTYLAAPYPEAHASTIVETPEGLVAAWFGGTKERNPDVCIWVSRYVDGRWTEAQNVANGILPDGQRHATWNPVLFQVPGGELWLFYKIGPNVAGWTGWWIKSRDHGKTWSEPEALPEGFLGPIKNKPVMLNDGTILCPSSTEGSGGWRVHFEYTRDGGKTWQKTEPINDGTEMAAIQSSIIFHKDGRLQVLCRSKNRAILESWSSDNGMTWSPMKKTLLPNNNSGTDAVTLSDGRSLLAYNHVLPPGDLAKGPRTPLNVAVTKDGKTWYAAAVLESVPFSQYSYPSVIQSSDGLVHVVYTWRRQRIVHAVIDPSQLKLKKIKKGQWPVK
ncbi:MAG: exo-alpha-sialidase [Rikenellaceae bacterium]|nr:exo-alpha-sialidase [Rikenellaceae bacterium]